MSEKKKNIRPKPLAPRGFKDDFGDTVRKRRDMLAALADLYDLWGFEPLETSAIETVEALGKFLPDVDRPNDGVFAWQDADEGWLALRYDLTAPLARVAAGYRQTLPSPYRRYAMGPVWRNEKPGPGRFRQFYQCDADTIGSASLVADAEMAALMARALEAVGLSSGDYYVNLNNRKILNGVMEIAGLYDPNDPELHSERAGIVLRTIDKFDRFGVAGVRALLGPGRRDESGDFTSGAGLSDSQIDLILAFLGARGADNAKTCQNLEDLVRDSDLGRKGVEDLYEIINLARAYGVDETRLRINPAVVRGLGYYTGPVMEGELTLPVRDEKGQIRDFGSVGGGGRYDDLVKRFTGQSVPAVGISIGVDRLLAAMQHKENTASKTAPPVIVTVMDSTHMTSYLALVHHLRTRGIRAELYTGNPKDFGKQLKYADGRGARFAIIQGSTERDRGEAIIKDLVLGAQLAKGIESREEWASQPAQKTVPVESLASDLMGMMKDQET